MVLHVAEVTPKHAPQIDSSLLQDSNHRREHHSAAERDQNRVNQTALTGESDTPHDETTDYGAEDAKDDVPDNTVSGSFHDLPGQPACDKPDDDPPEDVHSSLLFGRMTRPMSCLARERDPLLVSSVRN